MKRILLLAFVIGMAAGCDQPSAPKASRGIPANIDRTGKTGGGIDETALPPGHPPTGMAMGGAAAGDYGTGPDVKLDGISLKAPDAWKRGTPRSSFILAEFALPAPAGKDLADGRLTVTTAGGSVEANIERWKSQFSGKVENTKQEKLEVAGLPVTVVDFSGDFGEQAGPFAPPVNKPGYRMIAAVIGTGEQLTFVKATGPQATLAAHAEAINTFLRSLKKTS